MFAAFDRLHSPTRKSMLSDNTSSRQSRRRKNRRRFRFEALESRRLLAAELDYGDAPDLGPSTGEGDYTTEPLFGGPSHKVSSSLYLGTRPSSESLPLMESPDVAGDADDGVNLPNL